jgi:endoglucanase
VVSLETSKTLPGAEIGGGPVIRVGDKSRTFDGDAESILQAARDAMQKEHPETKVQRQLMSGGNCEAIVFVLSGYRTTAMAIPLGNYHNVGPEMTIEPEYIHLGDFAGQVELLTRAAELTTTDTTEPLRKRYETVAETYRMRTLDSFARWNVSG